MTETVADETFDPELRRAFEFADQTVDPALVDHSKVKMDKSSLLLSGDGTFYTLQGEGPTMGMPCVFVRLHVCNLKCTWCDAWYTWNPATEEFWTEPRRVSFEEAARQISETWEGPDDMEKRVIFTGGEPLIQRKQLLEVSFRLGANWRVEVETNGTLMPTGFQLATWQFNCSPKLKNSENKDYAMVKPKVLKALNEARSTFKFVCRTEEDLAEIEDRYAEHISRDKIIIMPEGIVEEEISHHAKQLVEACKKRGWRMTPRFQAIFADGARRGV